MKEKLIIAAIICACSISVSASPMDGLDIYTGAKAMLSSSTDPNIEGNGDSRPIAAGQTLTITDVKGPGRITHIWFTAAASERAYGKLMVLRMYWDGEAAPSVEVPLNDFFAEGHGIDTNVNSAVVTVSAEGRAKNCYWPMPFHKSARITVTNEGTQPVQALFWQVDWLKLKKPPKDTPTFHAQYRQAYPTSKNGNYTVLEATGKGHLVGTFISVRMHGEGWFGEGDQLISIDGETRPSIQGTGSEDYWCDAWGLRPSQNLYYGFPISQDYKPGSLHTAYRWHIDDPIPFAKSIKMQIETKGQERLADGTWDNYARLQNDYSSVAYWYQTEPHAPFPALPKAAERLYEAPSVIEAESLINTITPEQPYRVVQKVDILSGGAQILFEPNASGAEMKMPISAPKPGSYIVTLKFLCSYDYGIWSFRIGDDMIPKPIDLLNASTAELRLGRVAFGNEPRILEMKCTGKNPSSSGYFMGLDSIELQPMK